jgi:hypothetical protein
MKEIDSSPHFNLTPFSLNDQLLEDILNNWSEKNNRHASSHQSQVPVRSTEFTCFFLFI